MWKNALSPNVYYYYYGMKRMEVPREAPFAHTKNCINEHNCHNRVSNQILMMRLVEFCYCWKTFSSLQKKKSSCGLANDTFMSSVGERLHKTRAEEKLFISPIGGQCALENDKVQIAKGNSSQQETRECNQGSTVAQLMIQFSFLYIPVCPPLCARLRR